MNTFIVILKFTEAFFIIYLLGYATFLLISVLFGGFHLYEESELLRMQNNIHIEPRIPISILIPAHNEEVTIIDSINSLFHLQYSSYEIIIIDDGSTDNTAKMVKDTFSLSPANLPVSQNISTKKIKQIFSHEINNIRIVLVEKENGGKGDALNAGINVSQYPYFVCLDADSVLQADSLNKIILPVIFYPNIVAVGGLVRVAQDITLEKGHVLRYKLPWSIILSMQVIEYDCSFLSARIFMESFHGNLIISGAFGLFKKDVVTACGGYNTGTLGEDMELVMRLHSFCRSNNKPYQIRYEPSAVCWSQAPSTLGDLLKQRKRWFWGLLQCMIKYRSFFLNIRFGAISFISYLYYLIYELAAPFIETFGIIITILCIFNELINMQFLILFYMLYVLFCSCITITSFLQKNYSQKLKISGVDIFKASYTCFFEYILFHWLFSFLRLFSLICYHKKKCVWGTIQRKKHTFL